MSRGIAASGRTSINLSVRTGTVSVRNDTVFVRIGTDIVSFSIRPANLLIENSDASLRICIPDSSSNDNNVSARAISAALRTEQMDDTSIPSKKSFIPIRITAAKITHSDSLHRSPRYLASLSADTFGLIPTSSATFRLPPIVMYRASYQPLSPPLRTFALFSTEVAEQLYVGNRALFSYKQIVAPIPSDCTVQTVRHRSSPTLLSSYKRPATSPPHTDSMGWVACWIEGDRQLFRMGDALDWW